MDIFLLHFEPTGVVYTCVFLHTFSYFNSIASFNFFHENMPKVFLIPKHCKVIYFYIKKNFLISHLMFLKETKILNFAITNSVSIIIEFSFCFYPEMIVFLLAKINDGITLVLPTNLPYRIFYCSSHWLT